MTLEQGIFAPDFTLMDEERRARSLSDFRGKFVVLYFYPKDDTPGCTKEACNFRDDYSAYQKAGVEIIGISPNTSESHAKFKEKYKLPFLLLADKDHHVCEQYRVWGRKKSMGREYFGVLRTTYLIEGDGKIARVYEGVKPAEHSREVLSDIEKISPRKH